MWRRIRSVMGAVDTGEAGSGRAGVLGASVVVMIVLHPFEPYRRALTAADAEADECALLVTAGEFFQAGQNQSRAGRADGMAEGNGAAVHVEAVAFDFAEMALPLEELAGELVALEAAQASEHLGGEGLVDFDKVGVIERHAQFLLGPGHREHWAKTHALGIAARVCIARERADWAEPELRGLLLGHHEERDGPVGNLR